MRFSYRTVMAIALGLLMLFASAGGADAQQTIQRKGYFGTISEIGPTFMKLTAAQGTVELSLIDETTVSVPGKEPATTKDLKVGDKVAVMAFDQSGHLTARQVRLVPEKSDHQHRTGVVVAVTGTTITIQDEEGTQTVINVPPGVTKEDVGHLLIVVTRGGPAGQRDSLVASVTAERLKERLVSLAEKRAAEEARTDSQRRRQEEDINTIRSSVDRIATRQAVVLDRVLRRAPEAAQAGIRRALENADKKTAEAMKKVDEAKGKALGRN